MHRTLHLACIVIALSIPSLVFGQQKGSFWKMPKLNPFKKEDRSQRPLPWANATQKKSSMGQRFAKRPKKLMAKTKDMMTPWKSKAKSSPRIRPSRPSRDSRLALRSKRDAWNPFSRWRGETAQRDRPTTPQEFIASRRPTP